MRKLITFVGATAYNPAEYRFHAGAADQISMSQTRFFSAALLEYLRTQNWAPEEIHAFGTPGSMWSLLWELVGDNDEATLAGVQLLDKQSNVEEADLIHLAGALSEKLGVRFHLRVLPEDLQIHDTERLLEFIAGVTSQNDELVLDITHGFRSFGLVSILSAYIVRRLRNLDLKGIYYGLKDGNNYYGISLELTRLADWAEALAQFRETGELLGLVRVLQKEPNGEDIAKHMQRFQYGIKTHQIGVASDAVKKALRQCRAERTVPKLTRMFMDELDRELTPFETPEIYKWQLRLAERALNAADYGAASRFMMEAIVSAGMRGSDQVTVARERLKVENMIKSSDFDPHTSPQTIRFLTHFGLTNDEYTQLRIIRNAVTHGTDPGYQRVEKLMAQEHKLDEFLRQCLKNLKKNLEQAAQFDIYGEAVRKT